MLKLFHNDMSVCAQKVRMLMCAKELEWESEHLNLRTGDQYKPEFVKLSPKALVPVLIHNENVILESNVIVEYLEDSFPSNPMFPSEPALRAKTRWWLVQLDAGLHTHIAAISFCLAFRFQLLERYKTEEELQHFISNMPDPSRKAFMQDTIPNGVKSERLKFALFAYSKVLADIGNALETNPWLVGKDMTAADIAYIPYIERLQQLGLSKWWDDKPQINRWLEKLRATSGYQQGIEKWKNKNYTDMMSSLAKENWESISSLI